MVKAERLYCLMRHISHFGSIDVKGLATRFNVSVRTTYRDLRSLSALGVPVQFEPGRGYIMAIKSRIELAGMDNKDAELLLFCLYNNPLNQSPYFRSRLQELNKFLKKEFDNQNGFEEDSRFHFDNSFKGLSQEYFELVEKFIIALFDKNKVIIVEKGAFQKSSALIPIGVSFKDDSAMLVLFNKESNIEHLIDVERLQGISLSNLKFSDQRFCAFVKSRTTQIPTRAI